MLHIGHLNVLERSRALGDMLIVGVSTDDLIKEYKGMPPVIPFDERLRLVQALGCVDMAVKQTILTEIAQLQEYNVDVVTIGDDWKDKHLDGLEWMKAQPGKEVVYLEYTPGVSTTKIKKNIIQNAYEIIFSELSREIKHMEAWKQKQ
jgi:glycerol-3-phosphate cytidylyltransferase